MQTFSYEDNYCATCKAPKQLHEEILQKYGEIRYYDSREIEASFFKDSDDFPGELPCFAIKICKEFNPIFQIFDRDGFKILG